MSPLKKLLVASLVLFMILTTISTYIRDFAGYSILVGIGLLIIGYIFGGGFSGYFYGPAYGYGTRSFTFTTMEAKAVQKERYYTELPRKSIIVMIVGAVVFLSGIIGIILNSTLFPIY